MRRSADEETKYLPPLIFNQYQRIKETKGNRMTDLIGVSMEDDGNATSWLPVDEIADSFRINDLVITDTDSEGWVIRINAAVEKTKEVISGVFKNYLRGICEIRNMDLTSSNTASFISEETGKMYSIIDRFFKEWLATIKPNDSKETKIIEWYSQLRELVLNRGEELFEQSTFRDLKGVEKEKGMENIATKYWKFVNMVNNIIGKGGKN